MAVASAGIRVGDPAPDFVLPSESGAPVRLGDFVGKAEVVLFFYPKDGSPACTAEACAFRDSHEAFQEVGAVVLGISGDSVRSHGRFAGRHRLPFPILSDQDGAVRARFGVPRTFGVVPGRVTYLIDRRGIVRHVFSSQFNPFKHVAEALRVLKSLREGV
ncbi:MAG: peroxiredoxin [Isosphaeraceae bacterium]